MYYNRLQVYNYSTVILIMIINLVQHANKASDLKIRTMEKQVILLEKQAAVAQDKIQRNREQASYSRFYPTCFSQYTQIFVH